MSPLFHENRALKSVRGRSIFDYADDLKVRVPTSCGRTGECHECIVEVRRGMEALTPPTEAERFLRGNYRLACQAAIADPDAAVEFSILRRQPKILTESAARRVDPDPATVRAGDNVCYRGESGLERIDRYRGAIYGLAIDVGTTTVVINLVDLERGKTVYTASFENPQRFGGSDVMNRISYDGGPYHGELQQVMLSAINFEIGEMCRALRLRRRWIYEAVVVGNSTMRDIFFGIDVQPIGEKPYKSRIELEYNAGKRTTTALHAKAVDLGLRIHPQANLYGGPLISSHVGADTAAALLAIAIDEQEEPVILIDVGTNTEVVAGNRERLLAASCPAGPAFEGGGIAYAMPGYDGAVEHVRIQNGAVRYRTIGDAPPQGICGSGLIDLLAELRRTGKMNELGVFADGADEFQFVPERGLSLSRRDASGLAQAKAANYCGQQIVLRRRGLPLEGFEKLYLAGGFANYIDVTNAIDIGFVANMPPEKIVKVGNAALEGATIMLVSRKLRRTIEQLVREIEHVELETEPDFFDLFVEGCMFKPMASP